MGKRMDEYDIMPDGMEEYLSNYGFHFSKKLCEWAVSKMRDRNGKRVQMRSKPDVDDLFRRYGVVVENNKGYDVVYALHMAISDFLGSSLPDEGACVRYVKDLADDKDGYDGLIFTRFVADCNGKNEPIIWSDVI